MPIVEGLSFGYAFRELAPAACLSAAGGGSCAPRPPGGRRLAADPARRRRGSTPTPLASDAIFGLPAPDPARAAVAAAGLGLAPGRAVGVDAARSPSASCPSGSRTGPGAGLAPSGRRAARAGGRRTPPGRGGAGTARRRGRPPARSTSANAAGAGTRRPLEQDLRAAQRRWVEVRLGGPGLDDLAAALRTLPRSSSGPSSRMLRSSSASSRSAAACGSSPRSTTPWRSTTPLVALHPVRAAGVHQRTCGPVAPVRKGRMPRCASAQTRSRTTTGISRSVRAWSRS